MARVDTRTVGAAAEQAALRSLRRAGLEHLASNFRSRFGEIDLVMRDGNCTVFAEVRYRSGGSLATARLTVDRRKQRKLFRAASWYLACHPDLANAPTRFDVVAIDTDEHGARTIEWIRDAFRPDARDC